MEEVMKKKFKYPHFLMMFVDDVIAVVILIAYLILAFKGHASGFLALVAAIFIFLLIWHINVLIKKGIKKGINNEK